MKAAMPDAPNGRSPNLVAYENDVGTGKRERARNGSLRRGEHSTERTAGGIVIDIGGAAIAARAWRARLACVIVAASVACARRRPRVPACLAGSVRRTMRGRGEADEQEHDREQPRDGARDARRRTEEGALGSHL